MLAGPIWNAGVLRLERPSIALVNFHMSHKSSSKPGIDKVHPEPRPESKRRLHPFMVGILPY